MFDDAPVDYAMLVLGKDAEKGWINVAAPMSLFAPQDIALYHEVLEHQSKTLAAGADCGVALYARKGVTT